jgi:acyl carrier protein
MALSSLSPMPRSIAGPVDFEIDKIRGIIADYVGVNVKRVIDDAHFCDDLGLDWLERIELVLRIEDETGIEIPENDAMRIENVGNLLRHVEFAIKNEKAVASRGRNKNHSPVTTRLRVGMPRPCPGEMQLEMAEVVDGGDLRSAGKTRRSTCNC